MKKRLFLIDGSALAYRSYFAFIRTPLINSKGENTSAIFGFANTLRSLLRQENPEYLLVAFDVSAKTFRHDYYKEYKATREKMPEEMRMQLPAITRMLEAFQIKVAGQEGVEADDVIGTIAKKASEEDFEVYIVTGDKDFMQIVDERVKLYNIKTVSGETELIDREKVKEKFGVYPERIPDMLGLMGDASDNIPGVHQIGPKTATKLLQEFDSIENLYGHIDLVKPEKVRENLEQNKDNAFLSKYLATIKTNVPLDIYPEDLKYTGPDVEKLTAFYKEQEFTNFLKELQTYSIDETVSYHCIRTWQEFESFFKLLKKQTLFVLDTETDNVNPLLANLVGISFCFVEKEAYYIPSVIGKDGSEQGDLFSMNTGCFDVVIAALKPILENEKVKKCGHNIKYDDMVLHRYSIDLKGIYFDTMIASYLLRPTARQHNLDTVSMFYLNYKKIPTSDLIGTGKNEITMDKVPVEKVAEYSCEDADITFRLKNKLERLLVSAALMDLFMNLEMPLLSVLKDMEEEGIMIDTEFFREMSVKIEKNLRNLELEIYTFAGEEFNINSPQQLGKILFEKLEIHKQVGIKPKKTKIGYRTDIEILELMSEHKFPQLLIEYRQLAKLKSTYIDTLPKLVNPHTRRLHTSFNQTIAATGRLSSSDPNLQNIPVRTELGRQIRRGFIASASDKKLLSADYSQIELRILAHLSKDKVLIDAFRSGEDIHTKTASLIFNIPKEEVSEEFRKKAKAINFGIIYGMGQAKLARDTNISQKEAKEFIESYFQTYQGIRRYLDETLESARKNGYVTTLLQRKREVPELYSEDQRVKSNAENIAVNSPIQGTCADMIKLAMIDVHRKLQQHCFKTKLLLQIHDELLFEVPDDELERVIPLAKESMECALKLDVPIKVNIQYGVNWMEV